MLGSSNALYVSKNANKSKVDFDENLVAEATSYMFTTIVHPSQVLSIYRTQVTVKNEKNIRITGVDPEVHDFL
jgi:hypothetical protein